MTHDQSEQYAAFLRGDKALCVLELRKDPQTYNRALVDVSAKCGQYDTEYAAIHVHAWHSPEGAELVLSRDYGKIHAYLDRLHNASRWSTDDERGRSQIQLGLLFGYRLSDCEQYAREWTPEFCQCSKCVGVHRALEVQSVLG